MRFLLDTNILSDLVRHPRGRISDRIREVGEQNICTSIVVAAELRYGAAKKDSSRLTKQLEAVLAAIEAWRYELFSGGGVVPVVFMRSPTRCRCVQNQRR